MGVPRKPSRIRLTGKLGYVFKDGALLEQALTHGSSRKQAKDYERLEFLGDRVLSLVIADALLKRHHKEKEGKLAARHSAIVRGEVCAAVGEAMGLAEHIIVGETEKRQGVQRIRSVLGDVVEALVGAVYLDGGFAKATHVVLKHWMVFIEQPDTAQKDAKTFVQEWALAKALALPRYEVSGRRGPEHKPHFLVDLHIGDHGPARGEGASKQSAEMAAAQAFIVREGLR